MKRCWSCKRDLPVEAYGICRSKRDGLQSSCKECRRAYNASKKEEQAAYNRSYYQRRRGDIRRRQAGYSETHSVQAVKRVNDWAKKNPERYAELMREGRERRRARRVAAFVENIDRNEVLVRDGGLCYLCGEGVDTSRWHLDHVVPLSRGGEHSYANVAVTHPSCNQRKGSSVSYPNQKG